MDVYSELVDPDIVRRVNVHFYDEVYEHPWLSKYFAGVEKEFIVAQQTDFIVGAIGGPKRFAGRGPAHAHPHLMITDELYDLRSELLRASLEATDAPQVLVDAWLGVDEAFRGAIVKSDVSECRRRWATDEIVEFEDASARLR